MNTKEKIIIIIITECLFISIKRNIKWNKTCAALLAVIVQ